MTRTFLKNVILFTVLLPVLAVSAGELPVSVGPADAQGGQELVICQEPRPEMCTMDYQPVCGELEDGTVKTYSNGCMACSDTIVIGHREGTCE